MRLGKKCEVYKIIENVGLYILRTVNSAAYSVLLQLVRNVNSVMYPFQTAMSEVTWARQLIIFFFKINYDHILHSKQWQQVIFYACDVRMFSNHHTFLSNCCVYSFKTVF